MAVSFLHGLTYFYIEMHISGSKNHIDFACICHGNGNRHTLRD